MSLRGGDRSSSAKSSLTLYSLHNNQRKKQNNEQANCRGGVGAARAAGRRMDTRGQAAGRAAVARRGTGDDRMARVRSTPGGALDGGDTRGTRRNLDHGMRRRERDLLPALLRRARRLPRLRDEHRRRGVEALARGRTVPAALYRDDQR